MDRLAVPARLHQPQVAHPGQMLRQRRRRQADEFGKLADRLLAFQQVASAISRLAFAIAASTRAASSALASRVSKASSGISVFILTL